MFKQLDLLCFRQFGWDVKVWDLSPCFFAKEACDAYFAGNKGYAPPSGYVKKINSLEKFRKCVAKFAGSIFWHVTGFYKNKSDVLIFSFLQRENVDVMYSSLDATFNFSMPFAFLRNSASWFKHRLLADWRNDKPNVVLTSGRLGENESRFIYPDAKIISIPSILVSWRNVKEIKSEKYIVFVDECCVSPPDAGLLGFVPCVNYVKYYSNMIGVFERLEEYLCMPVVVAASEKYNYGNPETYFGNREVIYGKTLQLIQGAELVVGHVSLALFQALVSRKPVMLIHDETFTKIKTNCYFMTEQAFGVKHINSSKISEIDIAICFKYSEKKYAKSEADFLKSDRSVDYPSCFLSLL